jgi:hypothetical protein
MFFGNHSPVARLAPPFSALASFRPRPLSTFTSSLSSPVTAVLSTFQLSTINCQPLRLSPQAAQNDDPCGIVILRDISSRINSYVKFLRNSSAMNTYAMRELRSHSE